MLCPTPFDMSCCASHSLETITGHPALHRQYTADLTDESTQTRKLNGSSSETPSYQNLHRELLLSHKRYCRRHVRTLTRRSSSGFLWVFVTWLWVTVQRPAAGGETWAEASAGAAQTGAAQGGGDGTAASLRPGDRAPQEAAEAGGGTQAPITRRHLTRG